MRTHTANKITSHWLACRFLQIGGIATLLDLAVTEAVCDMCTGAARPVGCSAYQASAELSHQQPQTPLLAPHD